MYYGPALKQTPQYQLPGTVPVMPSDQKSQGDIATVLGTLWRRRRVFLALFVAFFGLVVLWTLIVPKKYTAEIKIIAGASGAASRNPNETQIPVLNALMAAATSQMSADTYVDLIQEYPVAERVIRDLKLRTSPYNLLQYNIEVAPVTNTSIIALHATWDTPAMAMKIANTFGDVFVERERELIAGQAGSAMDFLSKQIPLAQAAMHKADQALAKFQSDHPNVYIANAGNQSDQTSVFAAQQKLALAEVDQQQAQAQLGNVTAQLNSTPTTINGQSTIQQNPVASMLRTQLAQVEVQLESARKQYTDQHPTVIALAEQKAQLERAIAQQAPSVVSGHDVVPNPVYQQLSQQAANLRAQIAGEQGQVATIKAELGQLSGSQGSLPQETVQLANLQRSAKMAEDIYTALQQRYNDAMVAQSSALTDVAVTQPATRDTVRIKPNWKIDLILGLILGLVMGISGVFIIDFLDNTFKDEEDIQRALPLPLLTSVPRLNSKDAAKKLPWLRALTIESFLQLVTALRYSSDKPLRTLAITSPNQEDGKTTVAMSTAIAMAEIEPKVLLIDGDLRLPDIHKRLGLEPTPGMSDVLVGEASLTDAIQATKYDGLYVLAAGTKVPNPVKLIHSAKFDELIATLQKDYRTIVFDTPALQPVYDAAILAAKVDGTVLVISAGMTDMPGTKKALERLSAVQGVNVLGVVLNRAAPTNGYKPYYLGNGSSTPLPHEDGVASPS